MRLLRISPDGRSNNNRCPPRTGRILQAMSSIIITGGNQGLGYYIAKQLLEDGHNVSILDIDTSNISRLCQPYSEQLAVFVCNVSSESEVVSGVAKHLQRFKVIDAAIANAALCTFDSFMDSDIEAFRHVMDVNYFGAVHIAKAVLPIMEVQRYGRILFTSSGVGVAGFKNISPYASSKGAIESLAKCLKLEYADAGITCHIIHPPLTRTASAKPLSVPEQMKADPEKVGRGIAKHVFSNQFLICDSLGQRAQMALSYLAPLSIGRMMSMATDRFIESRQK